VRMDGVQVANKIVPYWISENGPERRKIHIYIYIFLKTSSFIGLDLSFFTLNGGDAEDQMDRLVKE